MSDILARHAAGESAAAIAADLGVTRQAVHARLKAAGVTQPQPEWSKRRAALVEDVQWLVDNGEPPPSIVSRLGYASARSLARAMRRAERPDLARYVERVTRTEAAA